MFCWLLYFAAVRSEKIKPRISLGFTAETQDVEKIDNFSIDWSWYRWWWWRWWWWWLFPFLPQIYPNLGELLNPASNIFRLTVKVLFISFLAFYAMSRPAPNEDVKTKYSCIYFKLLFIYICMYIFVHHLNINALFWGRNPNPTFFKKINFLWHDSCLPSQVCEGLISEKWLCNNRS